MQKCISIVHSSYTLHSILSMMLFQNKLIISVEAHTTILNIKVLKLIVPHLPWLEYISFLIVFINSFDKYPRKRQQEQQIISF